MIVDALRDIGGFIDKAIYWFVELLLQLILDLSDTQIFSQSVITEFANRIYIILGLVMLFKIIISFIQILINPDKMDDKEQGVGNILMRVVISLLLIVLVPSIFSLARQLQSYIIPIIPKVVLGTEAGSTDGDMMNTSGRAMAFYSYTAFFTYNTGCVDGSIYGTGNNDPTVVTVYDVGTAVEHITDKCAESSDGYRYKYDWPMSMIVGIYLVFMLVQIAIAVAIRAIKLGICEFIAPIPIASYIDPKTSKQAFNNWVSTSIKTYLDLFTRLIVVYFIVFVFMVIVDKDNLDVILANVGGDPTRQSLVIIAIIIGLLQFAKQAPKFISDMLGVKEGMGDIGGMFRGQGWKDMVSSVGGLAGMVTTPLSAALSARNYSKFKDERGWRQAGRFLRGFTSGAIGATSSAFSGKGWRGAKDAKDATLNNIRRSVNTRQLRLEDKKRYRDERTPQSFIDRENMINEQIRLHEEAFNSARESGNVAEMQHQQEQINNYNEMRRELHSELRKHRKSVAAPAGSIRSRLSDSYHEFTGTPIANSKTYSDAANLMNRAKSTFNDAKNKVIEKPNLTGTNLTLKAENGQKYDGEYTFAQIYGAYKDMTEGRQISDAKIRELGLSRGELETAYGNALKDAAAQYVDGVAKDKIDNGTMKEAINRWEMEYKNNTVISGADRARVDKALADGFGSFAKGADNIGAEFETKSTRLATTERAKQGDKS